MSEAAAPAAGARDGLAAVVVIAYALFLIAPVNGLTAIAGAILLHLKRDEARGTPWQSHVRNLLVVFWTGAILALLVGALVLPGIVTFVLALIATNGNPPPLMVGGFAAALPLLAFASLVFTIWYFYRVIAGLIRALDGRPF